MSQRTARETEKTDLNLTKSFWDKEMLKENLSLWAFSFLQIRMLFFLRPCMADVSPNRSVVRIPLRWRSRNHLHSMYFGAICAGVDAAGGFLAFKVIRNKNAKVSLIFKDIHGEFLKRAESTVYFVCDDGEKIGRMIDETNRTGERVSEPILVNCYTKLSPTEYECVAKFSATLSLKKKA